MYSRQAHLAEMFWHQALPAYQGVLTWPMQHYSGQRHCLEGESGGWCLDEED